MSVISGSHYNIHFIKWTNNAKCNSCLLHVLLFWQFRYTYFQISFVFVLPCDLLKWEHFFFWQDPGIYPVFWFLLIFLHDLLEWFAISTDHYLTSSIKPKQCLIFWSRLHDPFISQNLSEFSISFSRTNSSPCIYVLLLVAFEYPDQMSYDCLNGSNVSNLWKSPILCKSQYQNISLELRFLQFHLRYFQGAFKGTIFYGYESDPQVPMPLFGRLNIFLSSPNDLLVLSWLQSHWLSFSCFPSDPVFLIVWNDEIELKILEYFLFYFWYVHYIIITQHIINSIIYNHWLD